MAEEREALIIFHCVKDGCWIVARRRDAASEDDVYIGIAECPDEATTKAVRDGLQLRRRAGSQPQEPKP